MQVYEDTGGGYTEECSRFLDQRYEEDGHIELELEFPGNVRMMRIDPAMDCGICNIMELRFNGEPVPLNTPKLLTVNGKQIKSRTEDGSAYLTVIFPTQDPNISIDISRLQPGRSTFCISGWSTGRYRFGWRRMWPRPSKNGFEGHAKL